MADIWRDLRHGASEPMNFSSAASGFSRKDP